MQWCHQTFYTNHLAFVGNEIKCVPNTYIHHATYLNWTLVEKQIESGVTGGMDCSGEAGGMDCSGGLLERLMEWTAVEWLK